MAVKIRLMRIGAKKRPFYRVVAVDERVKRNGKYLELLGTYNPLTEPKEIILKKDRIDWWIKQGAQPSDGFLRITGQAHKKPPRPPKKADSLQSPAAIHQIKEDKKLQETRLPEEEQALQAEKEVAEKQEDIKVVSEEAK